MTGSRSTHSRARNKVDAGGLAAGAIQLLVNGVSLP